jgi:hypothetical protein
VADEKRKTRGQDYDPEPVDIEAGDDIKVVLEDGTGIKDDRLKGRQWYVVHCYSGYENKVHHAILQRIETMGMHDRTARFPRLHPGRNGDGRRFVVRRAEYAGRNRLRGHGQ